MKRFRFSLESVLTLRNWEEQRARAAFSKALRDEHLIAESLQESERRIAADVDDLRTGAGRTLPAGERALRWRHLSALEAERSRLADALVAARQISEKSRGLLVDAHRRVRVLENVKARQEQAHVAAIRRMEEQEIEELVSARTQSIQ